MTTRGEGGEGRRTKTPRRLGGSRGRHRMTTAAVITQSRQAGQESAGSAKAGGVRRLLISNI